MNSQFNNNRSHSNERSFQNPNNHNNSETKRNVDQAFNRNNRMEGSNLEGRRNFNQFNNERNQGPNANSFVRPFDRRPFGNKPKSKKPKRHTEVKVDLKNQGLTKYGPDNVDIQANYVDLSHNEIENLEKDFCQYLFNFNISHNRLGPIVSFESFRFLKGMQKLSSPFISFLTFFSFEYFEQLYLEGRSFN